MISRVVFRCMSGCLKMRSLDDIGWVRSGILVLTSQVHRACSEGNEGVLRIHAPQSNICCPNHFRAMHFSCWTSMPETRGLTFSTSAGLTRLGVSHSCRSRSIWFIVFLSRIDGLLNVFVWAHTSPPCSSTRLKSLPLSITYQISISWLCWKYSARKVNLNQYKRRYHNDASFMYLVNY